MIQFILILWGLAFPNENIKQSTDNQNPTVQAAANSGEGLDTGGDTGPVRPPKI
jgi:hypothetical protein